MPLAMRQSISGGLKKGHALLALLIMVLMVVPIAANSGELQVANLGDCKLESGEQITNCLVTYRVFGKRNADESNIVLMPTWVNGSSQALADSNYLGPLGIVDTDHYHQGPT